MPNRTIRSMVESQTVICASAQSTVSDTARQMKQSGVGTVMVVDNERLVGIFTERDALFRVLAEGRNAKSTLIADVMTSNPLTIGPDKPFGHALHIMYEGGFRHVPVVENGWPIGMVSARDALSPEMQIFESELRFREEIAELLA
ncbi:MAG: CBS domain-containing protein [Rhodocyclaceae bacterium]|jgi:signal-transduction protein with cAMP-binding, CBS, and nucleotidyltransferase domain|nr:CBS domain-containing protein [Rhodocyclaceae bacterium]MBP9229820.1 CBS domain-containing protein [Azonexus sp.]